MIVFDRVSVTLGANRVLSDIDAHVEAGELCVLVGPSGSGKSTLLRLVNGLVRPDAGAVRVRGRDVSGLDPAVLRRSIGYAIQSVGLFPHWSVGDNIATVPRLLGWPRIRIRERVAAMMALVRLDPELERRPPSQLSGGQAQRVGLARALAGDPDILLMDEPFGAVDPIVRRELRVELARIHAATGKTILLVTHDPGEAIELATRVLVLRAGRMVAAASPFDLVGPQADAFVRELIGGGDFGLRRLMFPRVGDVMDADPGAPAPAIRAAATLREALARMVETRSRRLVVRSPEGTPVGSISLERIVEGHP